MSDSAPGSAQNPALAWARENLDAGVDPESIISAMTTQGWTELAARQLLDQALSDPAVTTQHATPIRAIPAVNYATPLRSGNRPYSDADRHLRQMGYGAILLAIGVVITVGSYTMAASGGGGGGYLLMWGPILFGLIRLVTGFLGWIGSR
jgi:hypothetical protein